GSAFSPGWLGGVNHLDPERGQKGVRLNVVGLFWESARLPRACLDLPDGEGLDLLPGQANPVQPALFVSAVFQPPESEPVVNGRVEGNVAYETLAHGLEVSRKSVRRLESAEELRGQ